MKKLSLYLPIALIFLYSCKKSNSGSSTPSSDYYLSSVVAYSPNQQLIYSFYYDSLHRITTFTLSIIGSFQFTYQGTDTWPSAYNYPQYSPFSGPHLLSYDAEHRIIKDTTLNSNGLVTYFSYPNNDIVITQASSGPFSDIINTLVISNGNVTQAAPYAPPVQPNTGGVLYYTYASITNPAYHPLISNSIGPLLTELTFSTSGIVDFISKNAWQATYGRSDLSQADLSEGYTLDTDNKGRLVKMARTPISPGGSDSILFSYY